MSMGVHLAPTWLRACWRVTAAKYTNLLCGHGKVTQSLHRMGCDGVE